MRALDPLYIPKRVLHRSREVNILLNFLNSVKNEPLYMSIYGFRGVGKTVVARWVLSRYVKKWGYLRYPLVKEGVIPMKSIIILDDITCDNDLKLKKTIEFLKERRLPTILIFEYKNYIPLKRVLREFDYTTLEFGLYSEKQLYDIVLDRINEAFGELPILICDFLCDLTLAFDIARPGVPIRVLREVYLKSKKITPRILLEAFDSLYGIIEVRVPHLRNRNIKFQQNIKDIVQIRCRIAANPVNIAYPTLIIMRFDG